MGTPQFIETLREKIGHEQLWLTGVTAVVVRDAGHGHEVLLVRRADSGRITPVTGIIDPGEEPAVSAERETLEETGVKAEAERLVWVHTLPPMRYPNGDRVQFLDILFRCRYLSGEPYPSDGENTEAFWATAEEADRLLQYDEDMQRRVRFALDDHVDARFER
jgi:8-oxo-dGTP pyrophosphatase MutT (NUDIX family)